MHQSAHGKKDKKKKKMLAVFCAASEPPSLPNLCIALYMGMNHANMGHLQGPYRDAW